jgi:hypothetical protein
MGDDACHLTAADRRHRGATGLPWVLALLLLDHLVEFLVLILVVRRVSVVVLGETQIDHGLAQCAAHRNLRLIVTLLRDATRGAA